VITAEGRFFRVSVLRRGRVESYLCETEAEARRFAELLSQPPVETGRRAAYSAARPQPRSDAGSSPLRLVRSNAVNWKAKP
jgi:hypothetical protein